MPKTTPRYRLKLEKLDFISAVDTPAQSSARVLLIKRAGIDTEQIEATRATVAKVDDSLGLVFCWAFTSTNADGTDHHDLQGDCIDQDFVKAAADFMQDGGASDEMHDSNTTGRVVFAMPMTPEIAKVYGVATNTTGLMIALKPSPDALAKFKSGEYTGVSIAGLGTRVPVDKAASDIEKRVAQINALTDAMPDRRTGTPQPIAKSATERAYDIANAAQDAVDQYVAKHAKDHDLRIEIAMLKLAEDVHNTEFRAMYEGAAELAEIAKQLPFNQALAAATAPYDEQIAELQTKFDAAVENFSIMHNLEAALATKRLQTISPSFLQLCNDLSVAMDARQVAAMVAQQTVEQKAMQAAAFAAKDWERRMFVGTTPTVGPHALALRAHVDAIAKKRAIPYEVALAKALNADPRARELYEAAATEDWSVGA